MTYKAVFCMVTGLVGGVIAQLFGGWTAALTILVICMGIDWVTGLLLAGVFQKSPHTETGGLSSAVGIRGIVRKVIIIFIVILAHFADVLIGTGYIRDAVAIAFVCNEALSIIENAGLMGVPVPSVLMKAIDVLRRKAEPEVDEDDPD